jgi:DUF4097 and DUF4098 domain-containing protein YvlB
MRKTFETPGPLLLDLRLPAGEIELETAPDSQTVVELEPLDPEDERAREVAESARVELRDRGERHEVVVEVGSSFSFLFGRMPELRLAIRAPEGAGVEASTSSADIDGHGRFGAVEIDTASGDVRFEDVEAGRVNSASADVRFGRVGGEAAVNTASGDVTIDVLQGAGKIRCASGDVSVGEAASDLVVQTASGDQSLGSVVRGDVRLQSASGDIRVGVRRGSKLWVDAKSMSGTTSSELEVGDTEPESEGPLIELRATAMSGDIRIVRG